MTTVAELTAHLNDAEARRVADICYGLADQMRDRKPTVSAFYDRLDTAIGGASTPPIAVLTADLDDADLRGLVAVWLRVMEAEWDRLPPMAVFAGGLWRALADAEAARRGALDAATEAAYGVGRIVEEGEDLFADQMVREQDNDSDDDSDDDDLGTVGDV